MRHFLQRFLTIALVVAGQLLVAPAWSQDEAGAEPPVEVAEDADVGEEEVADPESTAVDDPLARMISRAQFSWSLLTKLVLLLLLLLAWVGTVDWANRDAQIHSLGYRKWNPILALPLGLLAILFFFLPLNLWIVLAVLFVVYLATTIPYVLTHNKAVESHQTVFTPQWWRFAVASVLGSIGVKVDTDRKAEYEKGAPVDLMAMGAEDPNHDNANLITARQSPGYLLVKDLVAEMMDRRSERARLNFTQQAVDVRHEIDGVWHPGETLDRASADVMLAVMKTLCNMDVKERRKKQTGKFGAKYKGQTLLLPMFSEGVKTGERVVVTALSDKDRPKTYDELGMREGLQATWSEIMALDRGLVLFAAMPGDGLTTMADVSISETDRLMRDFVAIEEVNHREQELQNVGVTTYDAGAGQTPADILPDLIRTYPNVYVLRDFVNPESAKLLLDEIVDDRLVITTVRARDSAEALLRMLQMKVPHKQFVQHITAVLYQRLIRTLCPDCKVGFQPSPDVLKKLGIPQGKVSELFRPPKPEEVDANKPCETCQGIGYRGRTGLFELLQANDAIREVLMKQPKIDLLRKAARASGQRSLQEEGILLVAKGVTSLPELQRVLKAGS